MNIDYFDCKTVIFNHRTVILTEGEKEVDIGGVLVLHPVDHKEPICNELHYHPEGPKPCVEAHFDDGTIRFIFDFDEVSGTDATPENMAT